MNKRTHGGKRANAGRKKVKDKKIQVPFYIRESKLAEHGGIEGFRTHVYTQNGIED